MSRRTSEFRAGELQARLNRIASQLEFVETDPAPSRNEVLDRLEKGVITAAEAIRQLEGR